MRDRRKRNITIGSLCCLLVFMGIGYALLSQTLNINGTATMTGDWKIYIDSIIVKEIGGSAKSTVAEVSTDKQGANFDLELLKPGDYVEYEVVVKNDGTINAVLRELMPNIESNNMDILLTHSIIQGQILKAKSETKFTLKIRFDERATQIVSGGKTSFDIRMLYEQYEGDASEIDPSLVPVTSNDCFVIDNNGIITDYDYSCGTYVTVPAVVNGITVKEINKYAFKDFNIVAYLAGDTPALVVAYDLEAYNLSAAMLKSAYGVPEEMLPNLLFMKGTEPTEQLTSYEMVPQKITTSGLEEPIANIEYLDLSQASGLTRIATRAFAANESKQVLRYLNLEGVNSDAIERRAFDYSSLVRLTVDTDFDAFDSEITIDTLRIVPSKDSTEVKFNASNNVDGTKKINNLIIADGITKIGNEAFQGHWNIANIKFPETLIEIGNNAFEGLSVEKLTLPASLRKIGARAFYSSDSLTSVSLAKNYKLEFIGDHAFADSSLETFNSEVNGYLELENVKTISENAFMNADLVGVSLRNVNTIGRTAFANNQNLEQVLINTKKTDVDNNVYYTDSIGEEAFANCAIQIMHIQNIDTLGTRAFYENKIGYGGYQWAYDWSIKQVKHIGVEAFYENPLYKPNGVPLTLCGTETIGSNAFYPEEQLYIFVENENVTYNGVKPTNSGVNIGNVKFSYDKSYCRLSL